MARRRPGHDGIARGQATGPKPRRRDFSALKPDPDKIGISGSVPFVRLPDPAGLFADRAARLVEAAPGHPLEAYLRFVAEIARAQSVIQARFPAPAVPDRLESKNRRTGAKTTRRPSRKTTEAIEPAQKIPRKGQHPPSLPLPRLNRARKSRT